MNGLAWRSMAALLAGGLAAASLAGCGAGLSGGADGLGVSPAAVRVSGNVHGGQQPVARATIQLYAVNTLASKGGSTPLIGSTVMTTAGGNFTITGTFTCGSATQVYLVATGGNPGAGVNGALALMAALGPCSALTPTTFIQVNELTTVAAAYALAPFMADYAHAGAANTASGSQGIANAFATAGNLVSVTNGTGPGAGLPAGATVPTTELNTLANILAACVNSTGASSPGCTTLLGATGATETIGAALAIADNPGAAAITGLYSLSTATAPFQPSLALNGAPKDWTVAVKYTGNGLAAPYGLAVDATGNVWVANEAGNSVTRLSNVGMLVGNYAVGGLLMPRAVAIDKAGNAWVANTGRSNVVELTSAGAPAAGSPFSAGGISAPEGIAIDSNSQVWVANGSGNSITSLNSAGGATNGSPLTGGGNVVNPAGIALDGAGNVWVSSTGPATVAKFSNTGALLSGTGYTDQNLLHPLGIALDASGNAWVAANAIGGASAFANSGAALASSPVMGGGLSSPAGVAVDGAGAIWLTNALAAGSLSKVVAGAAVSPAGGFGAINAPVAVAIDSAGNVWTANAGDSTLSEFVGLAAPVVTPLAATVGP